jgi:DNA-directed RNA polymerase
MWIWNRPAAVHDSYAVHACDVDLMARVLREQFIRVHTEFTLAKLYEDLKRQAPGLELPPPALGTLDLAQVRASEYFFC